MSIKEEFELSKRFWFETNGKQNGVELVALTVDNVARAEAMLHNDSTFKKSFDTEAKPEKYTRSKKNDYKYGGSTAYWLTQLKEIIDGNEKSSGGHDFEFVIHNAVIAIDRENSTLLNLRSGGNGRNEIRDRIIENRENLCDWLRDPEGTDFAVIEMIAKETKGNDGKKGKKNPSFASKFAHYACYYLFEGTEYQDNFSIYDSVLRKALPLYLKKYEIEDPRINDDYAVGNYKLYQHAIDELREKVEQINNEKISRNGLDHLLWYAHKGNVS